MTSMRPYTCTLLILLSCTPADALLFTSRFSTFNPWKPAWMERDDLLCDRRCKDEYGKAIDESYDKKAYDKCCECHSSTTWERDELLVDLYIEYTTADGESVALPQGEWNNSAMYSIIHTDGVMTSLPGNICNISNLMYIDFSGNKIRSLSGIECATSLDTVILKNNRIDLVSNSSIANLTLLRYLDLSHNLVTKVEPNTISNPNLTVLWIDLSDNNITSIDVTNMMTKYMFCLIDFNRNQVSKLNNEHDFKLDLSQTYGPGMVDLKDNEFVAYPNFQKLLNLDDLSQIGKLFEFGFDFRGAPILCDCNMENFLGMSKDIIATVWRDYHNVTCAGPEKYKGVPVVKVPLPDMVCSLGVENDCPVECSCVDQPYHNTITIDCVNALMTSLPAKLPESDFSEKLDLNMTGNNITEISEDLAYLERIDVIDLTGNDLAYMSEGVASRMENASRFIIVNNPRLKSLPQLFQYRNACSLALDEMVFDCNCNSRWIEQWMDTRGCHNDDAINNNTSNNISTTDTTLTTHVNFNNNTSTIITINSTTAPSIFVTTTPQDTTTNIEPITTTTVTSSTFNRPYDNNNRNGIELSTSTSISSTSPTHNNNMNGSGTTSDATVTSTPSINITDKNTSSDIEDDETAFYCRVPGHGVIRASDFKKDMLSCGPDTHAWIIIVTYTLISVLTGLILVAAFVYIFRYEILILFIRNVLQNPKENVQTPFVIYDAFVSFDEENPDLINWTEKVLIPNLKKDGYKLFIPYRHLEYGAVRDDATIEAMKKSRNMLLLMSESYLEPTEERSFTENEWKYGWNNFKSNRHTPIIVVNFDHITSDMVDDLRIKAYLRVGKVIDFTNHSRDIMPTIEAAVGKRQKDTSSDVKPVFDDLAYSFFPDTTDGTPKGHFQPETILKHINVCHVESNAEEHLSEDEEHVSYSDDEASKIDLDNMATNRSIIQVKPIGWTQVMSNRHEPPAELIIQDGDRQRHDNVKLFTFESGTQNSRRSNRPNRHQDAPMYNDNDQNTHWGNNRTKDFMAENELYQNRSRENTTLFSGLFQRLYKSDQTLV